MVSGAGETPKLKWETEVTDMISGYGGERVMVQGLGSESK